MEPDFFPFLLHYLLLFFPNMHDTKRGKSSFDSRNIDGMNPSFASLNMDLGWMRDNLSYQDLNLCCKVDSL